jgi:two-component sensor histidine kinase/HAMP domain-containing protein
MKLSTRLILLFLILSLTPLLVIGYIGFRNGIDTMKTQTMQRLVSINNAKGAEVNRWINACQSQLKSFAQRPSVRSYAAALVSGGISLKKRMEIRRKIIENHFVPGIETGMGFVDLSLLNKRDGQILISTVARLEGLFRENEEFFKEGQKGTFVDDVNYSLTTEQLVMHVSTPVTDTDGNSIAVLAGYMDWREMSKIMLQTSGMSKSEESYIVNKFNFFVTESRFGDDYRLSKSVHTQGTAQCLAQTKGVESYIGYRGNPVIGAYRWMPEWELCIITEEDEDEALAAAIRFSKTVIGIVAVLSIATVVVTLFFARTITKKIGILVRGAKEFAQGNLDYRIPSKSPDEIGQLADAYNHMARVRQKAERIIQKSRDELEIRVRIRTKEIEKANEQLKKEIAERHKIENALRQSEGRIKRSLAEKEVLLKEVHHRVKNNMQLIQSLLNLQASEIGEPLFKEALADSNNRIKCMGLIHETLYRSDDIGRLNFEHYIKQLVTYLHKVYSRYENIEKPHFKIDQIEMDMDMSITCGLILNELATNAFKYAFNRSQKGIVEIELQKKGRHHVELVVRDNGIGLPDEIDIDQSASLGLKIVSMLAQDQLQGTIHIHRGNGTAFHIRFPLPLNWEQ